jgi:hypothetical protein
MIEHYQFMLNKIKKAIKYNDGARLERIFSKASDLRKGLG